MPSELVVPLACPLCTILPHAISPGEGTTSSLRFIAPAMRTPFIAIFVQGKDDYLLLFPVGPTINHPGLTCAKERRRHATRLWL